MGQPLLPEGRQFLRQPMHIFPVWIWVTYFIDLGDKFSGKFSSNFFSSKPLGIMGAEAPLNPYAAVMFEGFLGSGGEAQSLPHDAERRHSLNSCTPYCYSFSHLILHGVYHG